MQEHILLQSIWLIILIDKSINCDWSAWHFLLLNSNDYLTEEHVDLSKTVLSLFGKNTTSIELFIADNRQAKNIFLEEPAVILLVVQAIGTIWA